MSDARRGIPKLVETYYAALYRFALSLTKSAADASDLTQQTFFIWATKGEALREIDKAKSWLFTTLYREFLPWLERQRKFDGAVAGKLHALAPPAGLREAILAGVRARRSKPRRRWWSNPAWLAAAAAVALIAGIAIGSRDALPNAAELAQFALRDLEAAHDEHVGYPPGLAGVRAQLAVSQRPLTSHLALDFEQLRGANCRTISLGGREVFKLCFQRNGSWFHLYAARRSDFAPGTLDPKALFSERGSFASTAWADSTHVFALVTHDGAEALRSII